MCATVSGLYADSSTGNELRLDVDGHFPQSRSSGTFNTFLQTVQWIAELTAIGPTSWEGSVVFKHPETATLPFTAVGVSVSGSQSGGNLTATVTFSGAGPTETVASYSFQSPFFHRVQFEFDAAAGTTPVTSIETHDHENRPATLPDEELTIEEIYRRAGFDVSLSTDPDDKVPISFATTTGEDVEDVGLWDDNEMHDAMQSFWSRFEDSAQWAMWVFFASLHEADEPSIFNLDPQPEDLGGIMFDSIGPNHRQGTAIFNDSFIANAPADDAAPDAWVRRMRFWTAVHEMGHAFNLAHAWQKQSGTPWRPLTNDPEARSFMNYPFRVSGGQSAFFSNFPFRFIDSELEFLRHAPQSFVQMGNAAWFDDHGFRALPSVPCDGLQLELRVNRSENVFEFLEPVTIELKLKNTSDEPRLVDVRHLRDHEHMTVILKKDGKPARQFSSYAKHCWRSRKVALDPGEAAYESLFVSSGNNGWDLSEPGYYTIQIALSMGEEHVISNPLRIRVTPPRNYDEEYLAQDLFSDDVGRAFALDGTVILTKANDTLREVVDRLADRRVAIHARVALGVPLAQSYKKLELGDGAESLKSASSAGGRFVVRPPDEKAAVDEFDEALFKQPDLAAESLGHVDFKYYSDRFCAFLEEVDDLQRAEKAQQAMHSVLSKRGVLESVLRSIDARCQTYATAAKQKGSGKKSKKTSTKK